MLAGAVNFGDGKNFGSGTRQTGTVFYGFLSLWMGGSRCKSTAPTSSGRTATFSSALICGARMRARRLSEPSNLLTVTMSNYGNWKGKFGRSSTGSRDIFTPAVRAS